MSSYEFRAFYGRSKRGGTFLNVKGLAKDLKTAREDTAAEVKGDLEKVVKDWEKKTKFTVTTEVRNNASIIRISTSNKIFILVNDGTRPHIIRPKKAKFLHFKDGYIAKTIPNHLESRLGGTPNGAGDVFAKEVHHPGTVARNFFRTISRLRVKSFQERVDKALSKV
jgi:hypothetical protein